MFLLRSVLHKSVSLRQRSKSPGRARVPRRPGLYRPQLLALEDRLPPGDVLLGAGWMESLLGPGLLTLDPQLAVGEVAAKGAPVRHQAPAVPWEALTTTDPPVPSNGHSPGADSVSPVPRPAPAPDQGGTALPIPEARNTSRQVASLLAAAAAASASPILA